MAAMKICLFLLLGTLIVRGQGKGKTCDKSVFDGESKVCSCQFNSSYGFMIVCSNVLESQDIVRSFGKVNYRRPMTFVLENSTALVNLPTDLFTGMKFIVLLMTNVDLPFLGNPEEAASPLSPLNATLYKMVLRNVSYLHNWDWSKVEPMKRLRSIEIYDSRFDKIQSSFSHPFKRLASLKIENSNVHWIEDGAIPAKILIELDLKQNCLKELSIKAFTENPTRLEALDLRENQIEYLKRDLLDGLPVLRNLYLDGNKMFQFSEQVFESWEGHTTSRKLLTVHIAGTHLDQEDRKAIDKVKGVYNVIVRE